MNAIVQQLPAVIGVLVGALASYAATSASELRRWRRERKIRWDERRLNAYLEYAAAVKATITASVRVGAGLGIAPPFDPQPPPMDLNDALPHLVQADTERAATWEALLLLGDTRAVEAARSWSQAAEQIELLARRQIRNTSEWQEGLKALGNARKAFYEQARRDLGIEAGT